MDATNVVDQADWRVRSAGSLLLVVEGGSRSFGFSTANSDSDRYGVYAAPTCAVLSVRGLGKQTVTFEDSYGDVCLHECGKFCHLALQGNPTILNVLWTPSLLANVHGISLQGIRHSFLHRGALNAFLGYAKSQFGRLEKGQSVHSSGGKPTGKWAAHLLRILWQGLDLAETGDFSVRLSESRLAVVRPIMAGVGLDEAAALARTLIAQLKQTMDNSTQVLPDVPDETAVNSWLHSVRKTYWDERS